PLWTLQSARWRCPHGSRSTLRHSLICVNSLLRPAAGDRRLLMRRKDGRRPGCEAVTTFHRRRTAVFNRSRIAVVVALAALSATAQAHRAGDVIVRAGAALVDPKEE